MNPLLYTLNNIGTGLTNPLNQPNQSMSGTETPGLTTWRSHLGTATLAVSKGIVSIKTVAIKSLSYDQVDSTGYIPTREPDACVFGCWSLPVACNSEVAKTAGLSTCELLHNSNDQLSRDSTVDLIKDAPDVRDIRVKLSDSIYFIDTSDVGDIRFILPLYSDIEIGRYLDDEHQGIRECTPNSEIGLCHEIFSLSFADQKSNQSRTKKILPESESALLPNSRIIKKYTGIEEVISNLERLSLSDKEKRDVPVDWINQPPKLFSGKWDEDVVVFMTQFNDHVDSMGLNLDGLELISYFKEYLSGEASRISTPLSIIYPGWKEFIEKFALRFSGKERKDKAKKELDRLDIYGDEVLFTFARISTIFVAMGTIEESDKVDKILKKCSETDRYRIFDKGCDTFHKILEFFLTEEERRIKFTKQKKDISKASQSRISTTDNSRLSSTSNASLPKFASKSDISHIKCFKCNDQGHFARDCTTEVKAPQSGTKTPEYGNQKIRKLPFSTGISAPNRKKLDINVTPSPIRKSWGKDAEINLVEVNQQLKNQEDVTAITGLLSINGVEIKFQYDSGAAVNVISKVLAESLGLGPIIDTKDTIMPISGIGQSAKIVMGVELSLGEFNCTTDFHVLITTRDDLLLLGIGFFVKIGAEVSLKNKTMTIESSDKTHIVPLRLMTRPTSSGYKNQPVMNYDHMYQDPKAPGELNPKLSKPQSEQIEKLLEQFGSTFSEQLEDLKGALEVHYLGHIVNTDGILPDPQKLIAVENAKSPVDISGVKQDRVYLKKGQKLLLYPQLTELKEAIKKIHNEKHQNAFNTFKTLTSNYYAPGAYPIVKAIVECCERCQRNNYPVRRSENFHGTQALGPFQKWGIDVAGPMPTTSTYKNKYVILAVDYFTKWPIAVAVPEVNAAIIIAFLCEQIISNFGVPQVLISDRGTHLSNELVATFNRYLGINHKPVTAYRPQANGQVERTIQTFKQSLRKICSKDEKNWDVYIWRALLALRTSIHRTLGKTPAEIVYGLELLTPSIWEDQPIHIDEVPSAILRNREKFLTEVLPTYREAAYNAGVKFKDIEAKYYNPKVRTRHFEIGDKVLKALAEPYTKLGDRSVGPFEVSAILGDGVYEITDRKGNSDNVHSDRLTKYVSARGMIPVVQTGQARSTLPALVRPFRGRLHEDVVI
ncbi:Retrovirus-related Pol polyprotein from transposon [Smittium culicis]|uniref:Retrovirus-related Pol polyprotein from transposon n=1 Tax=Smittium culicis TaxID=133412 RepID=A0A1R1XJK4_9FUNG|nr:Retrovirus-related Pol polyprotein from transposon [Smittium culicis]